MATTFGAWVRQRRRALDLTQAELADRIGYSTITVRRIESGERRPSRELIGSLADHLAVPTDELDAFRALGRTLVGTAPATPARLRPTPVARLQPPPGPGLLVRRQRVADRLDEAWSVPLTTVLAPTGFGKTVATAGWADRCGAAWLSLQGADSDLGSLARAVVDAVRLTVPALDPARLGPHDTLIGPDGDPTVRAEAIAARLLQSVCRATARPIALVLDEVDALEPGSPGLGLLEALVRLAHPQLHLVLVSRSPVHFGTERLRARGQVVELGAEALRFTLDETRRLLTARLGDPEAALADGVQSATEGWPAAVRLACEALVDTPVTDRPAAVTRLGRDSSGLFGYLAADLLAALPDEARTLLRVAAALPELDVTLCRRLGLADAEEVIAALARRGVLRPRVADSTWLLSDVVRASVEQTDPLPPDELTRVRRVCAQWLIERDDGGAAIDLLRRAGDAEGCAALLDEFAEDLVAHGHAVPVAAVAELIPPGSRSLTVETAIGQALVIVGRWEESLACMRRVAGSGTVGPGIAYWTGLIHHLRGDLAGALAAYDLWRPDPSDDPAAASRVLSMRASSRWLLGHADAGRRDAAEALRLARSSGDAAALSGAHTSLAMIATGDGDRRANDVHDRLALEFAEAAGNALQAVRIRSNRGSHLVETADFELALEELDVAIELAELTGFATYGALARSNRAEALAGLGRHEEASAEFLAAAEQYDRLGSRLVMFPLRGLADLQLARGELGVARTGFERVLEIGGTVLSGVLAQAGLARVVAGTDPDRARCLAEAALGVATGLAAVPARLSAGWVFLHQGERQRAAELAAEAADVALSRRDGAGFAEARELAALAQDDPFDRRRCATEALAEWERIGNTFGADRARFVLAAVTADRDAATAGWSALRRLGMRDAITSTAGPVGAAATLAMPHSPSAHAGVRLLGPLRVFVGEREVAQWPSRAAVDLLRLLAVNRWIARARLARLLFPGTMPADADAEVDAAVAELRGVLDPGGGLGADHFVDTRADGVTLARGTVEVDAETFLTQAGRLLAENPTDTDDGLERLANLEAHYTGELLEGDGVSTAAAALREECRAAYLTVLRRLIDSHAEQGHTDEGLRYGLRLLRVDPYDEATHLSLVGLLAAARRHGEALRHYHHYTARMRELGIEPALYPGDGGQS